MLEQLFQGVDYSILLMLASLVVIVIVIVGLKDMQELRVRQQLFSDKESFWITQSMLSDVINKNNRMLLTRVVHAIDQTNHEVHADGLEVPAYYMRMRDSLQQSIDELEVPFGSVSHQDKELLQNVAQQSGMGAPTAAATTGMDFE